MKNTTSDTPLIVPEIIGNALIAQDAFDARDSLVIDAAKIRTVVTAQDAQQAGDALKALNDFLKKIEDARTAVKAPVLELGKKIDGLSKELTTAVTDEKTRLSKLV